MRGIGIGIIFSTIILSISHKNSTNTISDTEIIRRAEQLGMVKEINSSVNDLNELLNSSGKKDENNPTTITTTPTPTPNNSSGNEENVEDEEKNENTADKIEDANQELDDKEETKSDDSETKEETSSIKNQAEDKMIEITISKGMSSEGVSRLLEEKGIIEDRKVFNKYLKDNGFSRAINYGTYNIAQNASFYDIANLLVSK